MGSVLGTILDPAADKTLMTTLTITLAMKDLIPIGRIGNEEDMVGAVVYLASRAGSYISGNVIKVRELKGLSGLH